MESGLYHRVMVRVTQTPAIQEMDQKVLTGIEPVLLKAASAGANRAAGWGMRELGSSIRSAKIRRIINDDRLDEGQRRFDALAPEQQARVGTFLESPQFLHIAYSLATIVIVEKSGRKSEEALAVVKEELEASFQQAAGPDAVSEFSDVIFAALLHVVAVETVSLIPHANSSRVQAEAVKVVSSIAAAGMRNVQLLQGAFDSAEFLDFESDMRAQVRSLHATMRIPHAGTTRQVPYDRLFITPRLSYSSRSDVNIRPRPARQGHGVVLDDLLLYCNRSVILGDPGGGKSTLALKLAFDVAAGNLPAIPARVPFLVVLRDYAQNVRGATRMSIVEYLEMLCRTPYQINPPKGAIEYLLLNDRALVILDGLDELTDTSLRRDVVQAVEGFAYRYPTTQILVTSRRIGYDEAPLDADFFPVLQLMELSDSQVSSYAENWFLLDEGNTLAERQRLASSFLRDSKFVADLRMNPLMLSLMCGIYATENYIPRNRPEVYEKCALLLFERWDKQRGIQIPMSFDAHVYAAMKSLALYMYSQEKPQLRRTELIAFIKAYLLEKRFEDPDVAEAAAEQFIDFCKGRAWVLTDVGEEQYGFTHRTFLEYFSASQLVRLHPSAADLFASLDRRIRAREWDVVAQLALQILGRTVEDGADDFLMLVVQAAATTEWSSRASLLSFASRALHFIVPRPEVLQAIVGSSVDLLAASREASTRSVRREHFLMPSAQAALNLLGVAPELRSEVGALCRTGIRRNLEGDWRAEALLTFAFIPWIFLDIPFEEPIRVEWSYWHTWAKENWSEFAELARLAARRYYWIDVCRLSKSEIDLQEFISNQGAKGLYEYSIAGYAPYPPIAYQLLHYGGPSFLGRSAEVAGRRRTYRVPAEELSRLLVEVPTPWMANSRRYQDLTVALRWRPRIARSIPEQLTVMLSAPLVEIAGRTSASAVERMLGRSSGRSINSMRHLLGLRLKENVTGDEISAALAAVNLSPEAAKLLRRWIEHKVDFVKFRRRG
jgi:hypothetical protein